MRNLFIPEIGTEIVLAQDWTFNLHAERRNEKLFAKLGYTSFPHFYSNKNRAEIEESCIFILTPEQGKELDDLYDSCYTGRMLEPRYKGDYLEREHDRELFWSKRHEFYQKYNNIVPKDFIPHLLPSGTILKVDRIYIRKGNSGYSSLSFYIKNGNFKGIRFWAKLEEVNQLIIE